MNQEKEENEILMARRKEAAFRRSIGENVDEYDIELEEMFEQYMADDSK